MILKHTEMSGRELFALMNNLYMTFAKRFANVIYKNENFSCGTYKAKAKIRATQTKQKYENEFKKDKILRPN